MKLATYQSRDGKERVGVLGEKLDRIVSLEKAGLPDWDMITLIDNFTEEVRATLQAAAAAAGSGEVLAETTLDAPIPQPKHDLICIGQNYLEHALEGARYKGIEYVKPDYPVYFSKRVNRAVAPGGAISAHTDITSRLDYEAELAVVIGSRCDHVRPEDAFAHIFGCTIVNDVSARDIQSNHVQYLFGKSLDDFTPMGPWIVTADEFATPPHLNVSTHVNGEKRQDANTSEFIFDIPYVMAQLSAGIVLEPGDIIITGTPSGVGLGFNPPKFLKPGDKIECSIEGIGTLANVVK